MTHLLETQPAKYQKSNRLSLTPVNPLKSTWPCAPTSSGYRKVALMAGTESIGFKPRSNSCAVANMTVFVIQLHRNYASCVNCFNEGPWPKIDHPLTVDSLPYSSRSDIHEGSIPFARSFLSYLGACFPLEIAFHLPA